MGSEPITVADFSEVAGRVQNNYPGPPDSAKARLLDDLVQRTLLLEVAKQPGFVIDSLARIQRRVAEDEMLASSYIQQVAPRVIPVSEAEARALYDWRKEEARIQVVYTVEPGMARQARADLDRGEPFAVVANRYNLPGVVPAGGDIGYVAPGSLVDPLDEVIRLAPVGSTNGPLQAPGEGWFIIRVLDRRPHTRQGLDAERFSLYEMLRQRKQRILLMRTFDQLRAAYRLRVEPEGVQRLFERFNHPESVGADTDSNVVLAHWDGGPGYRGRYTMSEALGDLDTAPGEKPTATMMPSFQQWIETQALRRLAVIEARRRHLDEEPATARRILERERNLLLEAVYQEHVAQRAELSDQDLQSAYQRHAGQLTRLESARFQVLNLPDSSGAVQFLSHVRQAPSLHDAILLASPGLQIRDLTVRFPTTDRVAAELESFAASQPPGSYGGPLRANGKWMVFQLVSKQENTPSLASLDASTREALRDEAMEISRRRRLAQFTDSLRQVVPVQIHAERLKRIPWPVTSFGP